MTRSNAVTLATVEQDGAVVASPSGVLDVATYAGLRDGLLKAAVPEPRGIVVRVDDLRVPQLTALSVFSSVWMRLADWPGVPLVLVAEREPVRGLLAGSAVSTFVPTFRTVAAALRALAAPPPRRRREIGVPRDDGVGRWVRRAVRRTCAEWGVDAVAGDAVLVASELVENQLRHARSAGWLRLELRRDVLSVAVADDDPRLPSIRGAGDRSGGGRGLLLVDELSRTWGAAPRPGGGKVVWAVLLVPDGPAASLT